MGHDQVYLAQRGRPDNRVLCDVARVVAEALDVTKRDGGLRIRLRVGEQSGDIGGINEIVLLVVIPEGTLVFPHEPTEVLSPAELCRLDDHPEPRILKEGRAGCGRFLIRPVDRDQNVEIAVGLLLYAAQRFGNEGRSAIGRHANADILAHVSLLVMQSAASTAKSGAIVSFPVSIDK